MDLSMVETFKQKFDPSLLVLADHLGSRTKIIDGGFVTISTPEPLSSNRAAYLRRLGVNIPPLRGSGEQVFTFYQSSVGNLMRLARRPWVLHIELQQPLQ